jgi:hypothetical protein
MASSAAASAISHSSAGRATPPSAGNPSCQRARRQQAARKHEVKRKLRDAADALAFATARLALRDPAPRVCYRQELLSLASAATVLASELPSRRNVTKRHASEQVEEVTPCTRS